MKQRIYISNAEDRQLVAGVLFKNGYIVRLGREKNGKATILFVEFWRVEDEQRTA